MKWDENGNISFGFGASHALNRGGYVASFAHLRKLARMTSVRGVLPLSWFCPTLIDLGSEACAGSEGLANQRALRG